MPTYFTVTGANTSDITEAKILDIEQNCTYVFDRGYVSYKWWSEINKKGAFFVTRNYKYASYKTIRNLYACEDDNTKDERVPSGTVLEDSIIEFTRKDRIESYKDNLRLVVVKRDKEKYTDNLKIFTNDFKKTAEEIASLYKSRWEIELFFKWIKQNLKIKKFLSKTENGIKIQICIAMIAYVLIKLAVMLQTICQRIPLKSLIAIAKNSLFTRIRIRDPTKYKKQKDLNQLQFEFMGVG
jgi:IS4 transposase